MGRFKSKSWEQQLVLFPPYACIYMDEVKTEFLKIQNCSRLYGINIDYVFLTWNQSEDKLNEFLENINNFKYNPKFYLLDLNVSISESNLVTDLYFKETDRHQYLNYQSSHPGHIKTLIVSLIV